LGYRKLEGAVPVNQTVTNPSEPYPVVIFNEPKPISDNKIGLYIDDEFNYYLNIYENICHFGLPYKNWTEAPRWLLDMYKLFKAIEKEHEAHLINKQYKQ